MKHESLPTVTYYTSLAVLTVAPAWRSFLTTLEWPLRDAIISAVTLPCEEVWREGCLIAVHRDKSYTENTKSCVVTNNLTGGFQSCAEHTLFQWSCVAVSHALISNLANIPITDNGQQISANTNNQSDIQLCSNALPFSI